MNQAGQYILAIIVIVFFSGLFSAIETAYSVANKIRLKNMYSDGEEKAGEVLKVLENFDRFLVTALIGNNVVNIITATVGTLLFYNVGWYKWPNCINSSYHNLSIGFW